MKTVTKAYSELFNAITSAEETLLRLQQELMTAQRTAEELYIEEGDDETNTPA